MNKRNSCLSIRPYRPSIGKRVGNSIRLIVGVEVIARYLASLCLSVAVLLPLLAVADSEFEALVAGSERQPGFVPLYWETGTGRLYAEITDLQSPLIYYPSLSHGVGSNDLGLDRGRLGQTQLVQFERVGPRLLLVALNTKYRAGSDNADERRAVEEAFARSVLWGFEIAAEDDGRVLIDMTDFARRDALGLSALLGQRGEGKYTIDQQRSAINLARSKAFPDNTEIDALVTFTGTPSGEILATVAPDAGAVTLHLHHSFVRLPDDGYTPLLYDPRAGFIDGGEEDLFIDYAAPLGEPVTKGYARRHRLKKKHPERDKSEAIEPIIYYVDSGVPEPIRSALVEGASWWNQAFEAAGYIDAFQVKILPESVDPMDVRYNVIQWVHRSTRGWSYGMSVRDPRTQEIIKGHVSLGSLRVRQDYLLAEGLLAPYKEGVDEDAAAEAVEAFALARIRQLSAHEVGHTLGLEHNFAASADDRASVMDYPHPYVTLDENGEVDVSDAYAVGIGAWDKQTITWGYADFPEGVDEDAGRAVLVERILDSGLSFVADQHARGGSYESGAGPCHSRGSLWDNGVDPVAELNRIMALRRVVLDNFSEAVIRKGRPMAQIEDALVPAYLMHRYQLQAAATVLGGRDFTYALKGDGQVPTAVIDAERQLAALDELLATLDPGVLTLDPELVLAIPPRPPMSGSSRELFPRKTGYLVDPLAAAETAVEMTLRVLLDPTRAARLNQQRILAPDRPDFPMLLAQLLDKVGLVPARQRQKPSYESEDSALLQMAQRRVLEHLLQLAGNRQINEAVRAQTWAAVGKIAVTSANGKAQAPSEPAGSWPAHYQWLVQRIDAHADSGVNWEVAPVTPPPGSPI